MESTAFWLVWKQDGGLPFYRHRDRASANAEAERLARANPGAKFYVLEAIAVVAFEQPVTWTPLVAANEIPF